MKLIHFISSAVLLAAIPSIASAELIDNFTASLTAASPTELGRPFRSGIQQTWLTTEPYDGVNNTTSAFSYQTFTYAAALFVGAPYVEISFFDTGNSPYLFSAAYGGSYNVNSRATGWLGDQGASGNYFGVEAVYYDVILPANEDLVLVVNDTSALGLNDPFQVEIDAYADTGYDEPVAAITPNVTPEPSSFVLLGTGLAGMAGAIRRRFNK